MSPAKPILTTLFMVSILTSGCATTEFQTATAPISAATASQIIDGKDTKTDVIAMFGAPNGLAQANFYGGGYYPGMANFGGNQNNGLGASELLSYKNCTVKSAANVNVGKTVAAAAASAVTFGLSSLAFGGGAENSTIEDCKLLAVLLDDRDIVKAHGYVESGIFSSERIARIVQDKSTKSDVIRIMTVPSTITASGSDEILTYKNCLSSGSSGSTAIKMTSKQTNVCQQASFIIDVNSEVVRRITHIPFPIKKKK